MNSDDTNIPYLTAAEMRGGPPLHREIIPGAVLMNNAGAAVFREIDRGPVIVCGKGNNSGDGFVVARSHWRVTKRARALSPPDTIVGDAATFMRVYQNVGGASTSRKPERERRPRARRCAVLVDAARLSASR